jgi:hypothetical protein
MGGRGRNAAHMARARAKRAPFTEPRKGRLKEQIRFAFAMSRGEPLTTGQLVHYCYAVHRILHGDQRWYCENVRRAASRLAVPCGRGRGRGRPILWAPREAILERPFMAALRRLYGPK